MGRKHDLEPLALQAWEQEIGADLALALTPSKRAAHPQRVHTRADLPEGAFAALEEALGPLRESDLIVIPAGARLVDPQERRYAYVPTQVLAACERGAALWVERSDTPGVCALIPAGRLAAVDEEHILLAARLSLLGATARLSVHYNAVGRPLLQEPLKRLRGAAASEPRPTPRTSTDVTLLPVKWRSALASALLHPDDPVVAVFGRVPPEEFGGRRRECLLALTPWELIVIRDPEVVSAAAAYGLDTLYLPRGHMARASLSTGELRLLVNDAEIPIKLGDELAADISDRLGPYLPLPAAAEGGR
ncbi:hypothetical protein AB0395_12060 [Streptosporangium sp. NPDC051023]|uniref:hypothetical protein n=1 Tax=Streptosporangium sp. NPDC051023 TaxID=3155410 RepID=UPI00344BB6F2